MRFIALNVPGPMAAACERSVRIDRAASQARPRPVPAKARDKPAVRGHNQNVIKMPKARAQSLVFALGSPGAHKLILCGLLLNAFFVTHTHSRPAHRAALQRFLLLMLVRVQLGCCSPYGRKPKMAKARPWFCVPPGNQIATTTNQNNPAFLNSLRA